MKNDCIFCKFVSGEMPCNKIYEDEHTLAFLDIKPLNEGHTLVIPKSHSEDVLSISPTDFTHVMGTVRKLAPIIKEVTRADGLNIHSNHGPAAGQVIFHLHMHLIPRHANDGYTHWHRGEPLATPLKETQEKILTALG
jgi:histidine triad (HIT) family protein